MSKVTDAVKEMIHTKDLDLNAAWDKMTKDEQDEFWNNGYIWQKDTDEVKKIKLPKDEK